MCFSLGVAYTGCGMLFFQCLSRNTRMLANINVFLVGSFLSLFFPRSFLSWTADEQWLGRAAAEGFSLQLPHDHPERTIHLRIEKEI